MRTGRRPNTDTGTAVLHLIIVTSFAFLAVTGLRIAADTPGTSWLMALDPLLPMEHVWFQHIVAALVFTGAFLAHASYMRAARLGARIALDGVRVRGILRKGKSRATTLSVMVLWGLLAFAAIETVSGIALLLGWGGGLVFLHRHAIWFGFALAALHVGSHAAIGGTAQLTRIFRPAPLQLQPPDPDFAELLAEQLRLRADANTTSAGAIGGTTASSRSQSRLHPAVAGMIAFVCFAVSAVCIESVTRTRLEVSRIDTAAAPLLDGDLQEPAWVNAKPVSIVTTHGGDFGGTGQSTVEVRAVHDGTFAYFAFVWTDPTRSLKHAPLIKTAAGWEIATMDNPTDDEDAYHEDQFSVLLAHSTLPLIGAAIHLSVAPRRDRPPSGSGRGLHYTEGNIADVWVWRASHGGPGGYIDNCHFGPPMDATPEEVEGKARYRGGFAIDPGQPKAYRSNYPIGVAAASSQVQPERLAARHGANDAGVRPHQQVAA